MGGSSGLGVRIFESPLWLGDEDMWLTGSSYTMVSSTESEIESRGGFRLTAKGGKGWNMLGALAAGSSSQMAVAIKRAEAEALLKRCSAWITVDLGVHFLQW